MVRCRRKKAESVKVDGIDIIPRASVSVSAEMQNQARVNPSVCLANKARRLRAKGGKKAIANAVRRKKAQDPQVDRPGTGNKPINVSNRLDKKESIMKLPNGYLTEKNVPTDPKKWAAAKAQADKSKFDVYPSAYANAWASKKYKSMGGSWRKG